MRVLAAILVSTAALLLLGGCAGRSSVDGKPFDWSESIAGPIVVEPGPDDTPLERLAAIARLQDAWLAHQVADGELPSTGEIISIDSALPGEHAAIVSAELDSVMRDEIMRARTSEPFWNEVHYSAGFMLGFACVPPDEAFGVLDGWETFEHDSKLGRRIGASMDEGIFGRLWDLQHGMEGYDAGVAYRRGEVGTPSDANPQSRRGGYAN